MEIKIEEIYDVLILRHGFNSNNRDYVFLIETNWIGDKAGQYLLTFENCFELKFQTTPEQVKTSDWEGECVNLYPGFESPQNSENSIEWSRKTDFKLEEYNLTTELFSMKFLSTGFQLKKLNNKTDLINQVSFLID
jgi:hypothetical protein